jgi:hypothetical protein
VKKDGVIAFQMNANDFKSKGKADRYLIFYKQLLKKRRLTRFCRDAFIEKVDRNLNGQEEQYILLNNHIKSKGIPYILEAIREKENQSPQSPWVIGEVEIEKAVQQIMQAVMKEIRPELQAPTLISPVNTVALPVNEPELEKLLALL